MVGPRRRTRRAMAPAEAPSATTHPPSHARRDHENAPTTSPASGVDLRVSAAGDGTSGQPETDSFGPINWGLSVTGVVLLVCGYVLLSKANARGDNLPATLAPFLILGAYAMVFVAIVLRLPGRRP